MGAVLNGDYQRELWKRDLGKGVYEKEDEKRLRAFSEGLRGRPLTGPMLSETKASSGEKDFNKRLCRDELSGTLRGLRRSGQGLGK